MKLNILGKKIVVKTEFVVIAGAVLVLLGCLAGYIFLRDNSDIIIENDAVVGTASMGSPAGRMGEQLTQSTASPGTPAGTSASIAGNLSQTTGTAVAAAGQIKVYVVGCVNKPGIVTLDKGQVIDDAVRLAGGLTEEADADSINMVYKLNENLMLHIKSKKELLPEKSESLNKPVPKAAVISVGEKSTETDNLGKGAEILNDSGSSVEVKGSGGGGNGDGSGMEGDKAVNINTADHAELDKLPGVGEATAREIIAYREKNGPFRKIEDIMKVPRIKQGRFDSIKDLICVN